MEIWKYSTTTLLTVLFDLFARLPCSCVLAGHGFDEQFVPITFFIFFSLQCFWPDSRWKDAECPSQTPRTMPNFTHRHQWVLIDSDELVEWDPWEYFARTASGSPGCSPGFSTASWKMRCSVRYPAVGFIPVIHYGKDNA